MNLNMMDWITLGNDGEENDEFGELLVNAMYDEVYDIDVMESSIDTLDMMENAYDADTEDSDELDHLDRLDRLPPLVSSDESTDPPYTRTALHRHIRHGIHTLPSMDDPFHKHNRDILEHVVCNGCTTLLYDELGEKL